MAPRRWTRVDPWIRARDLDKRSAERVSFLKAAFGLKQTCLTWASYPHVGVYVPSEIAER